MSSIAAASSVKFPSEAKARRKMAVMHPVLFDCSNADMVAWDDTEECAGAVREGLFKWDAYSQYLDAYNSCDP